MDHNMSGEKRTTGITSPDRELESIGKLGDEIQMLHLDRLSDTEKITIANARINDVVTRLGTRLAEVLQGHYKLQLEHEEFRIKHIESVRKMEEAKKVILNTLSSKSRIADKFEEVLRSVVNNINEVFERKDPDATALKQINFIISGIDTLLEKISDERDVLREESSKTIAGTGQVHSTETKVEVPEDLKDAISDMAKDLRPLKKTV